MAVENLIIEHIDIWTSAVKTKSTSGRGSSKKLELYGAKKLRELILELAVRGKLVPQNPNDEPASVLLERIAAEKAQLVKEKIIRESKSLPVVSRKEQPFVLPKGWVWERLGNIGIGATGKTPSTKQPIFFEGSIPFIGPGQINQNGEILAPEKFLSCDGLLNSTEAIEGDILMVCIGGSIGKAAIARQTVGFNQQINAIRALQMPSAYLYTTLSTDSFLQELLKKATGSATPIINRRKWEELLVPIAPLDEQHRIVAKVDELMALCDQLEQQTEASIEAHQVLVTTLLDTLTNSADADELMQNWARISEHFDTLFTTEESIDQLKQTILQLAVMGKLVSQDPNDEPASELLKRIAEEKAQLILKKEIPKAKKFEEISVEDNAFSAPSNWSWVRLETVFNVIVDCPHSTAKFQDEGLLCIDTNSFKQGQLHPNRFRFVSEETFDKRNARLVPKSRDIIFAREGSVGESVVIPEGVECCLGQRVMLFRPSESLNAEFLRLTISNKGALNQLLVLHKGIGAKHVNVGDMRAFVICLPPKMEQDRIVDKVNELLGLCELLKSSLKDFQSTQLYLTDTIIDRAVQL
ncbi:restriction endonuclease subunit S [Vibrio fluvialis]|jgi:type I restriction enzyme S subunit|uniref:restriction endonuclease subunit S n=1 Tax=Vibrio fluvialis TaxID=676 RepID=UPI001C9DB2DB|nr:restriction endonuclease subunit S [Vibrio fluvialis]